MSFAGRVLNRRYRLVDELGRGGMGSVWRAHDLELDAPAAIKLIEPTLVDSPEALARFQREAKAAAAIRSTHVVQILGYGVDEGTPFIAMELMKGESLAKRLERSGRLPVELTLTVLTHVSRALALAHEQGIVHRDLKPDNIFLVREMDQCIAKVLDFGVAHYRGGLADSGGLKTKTGAILGTPYYMSPEQATGKTVDRLSDIWSFGVIAAECITGARPFDADSLGGLFSAICIEPIPVPSARAAVLPGFDAWFAQAVSRDKSLRFQSIAEAIDGLTFVCRGSSGYPAVLSDASIGGDATVPAGSVPFVATHQAPSTSLRGLKTTAAPSSRSLPGIPARRSNITKLLAVVVSTLVVGCLLATWRWSRRTVVQERDVATVETATLPGSAAMPTLTALSQPAVAATRTVAPTTPVEQKPAASIANLPPVVDRLKSLPPSASPKRGATQPQANLPAPEANEPATKPVAKPAAPPADTDRLGI